ncbi:MAG: hypothetical protein RBU30_18270 [Polyangia bacterium]|nr:hypothetical protein [Polyangia bacterium]
MPPWAIVLELSEYRAFIEDLEDLLLERELESTRQGGLVLLNGLGDRPLQLGLQTLAQACAARPREEWRALMASHLDSVLALGQAVHGPGPERRDFESVKRLIKVRLYPAAAVDGDPDLELIAKRVAEDLVAALAYDLPEAVTSVPPEDFARWQMDEDALFALGLENLRGEALSPERLEVKDGVSLEVLHGKSFFVASQILRLKSCLMDLGKTYSDDYGYLLAAPTRNLVLHYCIEDSRALVALQALIPQAFLRYHQGPGSLSPSVYWLHHDRLLLLPATMTIRGMIFRPPVEFLEQVVKPLGG